MIQKTFNWGVEKLNKHVALRYLMSGGTAGVTDLSILYVLNSIFGMHYLLSAVFAFIVAFFVSFTAHKFWTFKNHEESAHRQIVLYFFSTMFALFLNTLLMYVFVDHLHVKVVSSQIIVAFMVAGISFFISSNFVFKYKPKQLVQQ